MTSQEITVVLSTVADGRVRDLRYRQRQLISLHAWITGHLDEIETGFRKDDHLAESEAQFLVTTTLNHLRRLYDALDLKQELAAEYSVKNRRDNHDRKVPEELAYIVPEKFTLFYSVISTLCTCIVAGTCCLVELPNDLRHISGITRRCIAEALDKTAFVVVNARPSADILARCLVIDQVDSVPPHVGQRTLKSEPAAWSVAVVDRTANLELAAKEILASRTFFSGQGSYAPKCVLVNEFVETEFLALLRKHSPAVEISRTANGTVKVGGVNHTSQKSPSKANKTDLTHVVLSTAVLRIVKITGRDDLQPEATKDAHSIPLLAVSSYDDAIDALSQNHPKPLSALYIFAEPLAAKYLTQFIRTRASFVNHIPANLLVGPAAPIDHSVSPISRYRREMIEWPSPQFVNPTAGEVAVHDIAAQKNPKIGQDLYQAAVQPLKPMGQPKEGDMNFFAQGILAGFVFLVAPVVIGALASAGYAGTKLYRHWK